MNCPSRADPVLPDGYNQNPNALNGEATTRADLAHTASARLRRNHRIDDADGAADGASEQRERNVADKGDGQGASVRALAADSYVAAPSGVRGGLGARVSRTAVAIVRKYTRFVGPGFMIAVAYIDPGNYATDVAAGASFRFRLLFIVLMSNVFAIFLQSLCIKLGSVTGMNLAENCKANLPPWLNYLLYFFAESAIIATDIAEVIGTAIALNILLKVPLVAGCAISIVDVLIILIFYRPSGTMKALRAFEFFVVCLVLGVVICFAYELSKITAPVGEVFQGYLPSSTLTRSQALYQACGILGATVMPHSLYLGSGIVQPRLREYDEAHHSATVLEIDSLNDVIKYKPSLAAIQACMSYSIVELAVSLFTFALFVNSSILIVAGASLYGLPEADEADLFTIHALLASSITPVAGTMFALALLLSGISAGIVCTISGQMVSEGQLNWTIRPWLRRLITRLISITPSLIIAAAIGRGGLGRALEASQVVLSIILPFVSAPLLWFTCRGRYMKVATTGAGGEEGSAGFVQMRNHWITAAFAVVVWGVIVFMNVALLVLVGLGAA